MPKFTPLPDKETASSFAERVEAALKNIEATRELNIYLEVFGGEALERARALDARRQRGEATGPLAGWIISIKDNICYEGHRCSASSRILEGFTSLYSATAVERLLAADAIIIGRTNCDEFAMGSSNENSAFGPVRNPLDPERVPGGSSGGAAASVAAHTCDVALGSDTGGSIRQPAGFCGVVGLKPTYGRVSRYGLIAYGSSLDQIGPLAHSVEEAARVLDVIAGPDDYDMTALPSKEACYPVEARKPARIGVLTDFFEYPALDPEFKQRFEGLFGQWENEKMPPEGFSFPYTDYLIAVYQVISTAEASSNLARYAGMLYGRRSEDAEDLPSLIRRSRSEGFGPEVQRRIMLGTFVLSSGYYDAYYEKAARVRALIRRHFDRIWEKVSLLVLPVSPTPPFRIGEISDPLTMYAQDLFVIPANLIGAPAMALPVGKTADGLPIAIQLMAPPGHDRELLAYARYIRQRLT